MKSQKLLKNFQIGTCMCSLYGRGLKNCDGLSIEGLSSSETGKEYSNQHYNSVLKRFHNKILQTKKQCMEPLKEPTYQLFSPVLDKNYIVKDRQ